MEIKLSMEDAQRIFDLAVGADHAASGYMDSEDVEAMRRLAVLLEVDPAVCTGEEFVAGYPHTFTPDLDPWRIRLPADVQDIQPYTRTRREEDHEVVSRIGVIPDDAVCCIGRYGRCRKPASHPVHGE